ncbi:hypothetical protein QVD17_28561 [Tagetes erecta]|uniref:Uncharacterized protein n=1 Tax=Tagetes erecta TaxID=13708 RepID=A0AAD8KAS9_TARER|nr:hypothetical protein QVD17_28561 [Tagetes erecta]
MKTKHENEASKNHFSLDIWIWISVMVIGKSIKQIRHLNRRISGVAVTSGSIRREGGGSVCVCCVCVSGGRSVIAAFVPFSGVFSVSHFFYRILLVTRCVGSCIGGGGGDSGLGYLGVPQALL